MTFVEEFSDGQEFESGANYPTAFGITFTPKVSGIAIGLLGLVGAGYILSTYFLPAWDEFQKLKADEATKQQQVDQQKSGQLERRLADAELRLRQAETRKADILRLYASPNDLKTLLMDLNKLFKSRNVNLTSFLPQGDPAPIADGSLGPAVNNKLKRQTFQVAFDGSFSNTHNLIRDLERLQPLIIMKNLKTDLAKPDFEATVIKTNNQAKVIPKQNDDLKTSLTLEVLIPLTPEEIAALAPPPPPEGAPPAEGQPAPPPK